MVSEPAKERSDLPGLEVAFANGLIFLTSIFPAAMSTPDSLYVRPLKSLKKKKKHKTKTLPKCEGEIILISLSQKN